MQQQSKVCVRDVGKWQSLQPLSCTLEITAAWLAQLVECRTTEWEAAGSNPCWTNQGLKIIGKIMLAVHLQTCLSSDDRSHWVVTLRCWPCLLHL